uniref:Uncharacterized protein n=1 Tax=Rhizophora mucronata TaxID=61149 RepID=A0A2P2R4V3_RHIMU
MPSVQPILLYGISSMNCGEMISRQNNFAFREIILPCKEYSLVVGRQLGCRS